jgi:hypothetical protein
MNRVRRANGLRPLHADRTLRRAALAHTVDMLCHNYFAHGDSPVFIASASAVASGASPVIPAPR